MKNPVFVPNSLRSAAREVRMACGRDLSDLTKQEFVRAWCSIAYLFPGLHPDGFDDLESEWPRVLKRFASEAWRRAHVGELTDEQLYPCDATWSGVFDRMLVHLPEETERRVELASMCG